MEFMFQGVQFYCGKADRMEDNVVYVQVLDYPDLKEFGLRVHNLSDTDAVISLRKGRKLQRRILAPGNTYQTKLVIGKERNEGENFRDLLINGVTLRFREC